MIDIYIARTDFNPVTDGNNCAVSEAVCVEYLAGVSALASHSLADSR